MTKKKKESKIDKITSTSRARGVEETEALEGVQRTEKVGKVKGVSQTGAVSAAGRVVSRAEHAEIMKMIEEEADSLFKATGLSAKRKQLIKDAVRMAFDSGLIVVEDDQ